MLHGMISKQNCSTGRCIHEEDHLNVLLRKERCGKRCLFT